MDLKNARVLVTGGSSGIGKATARTLKEAGAKVWITGRDEEKLKAVCDELGVKGMVLDQSQYDTIAPAIKKIAEESGGFDVLINNAGHGWRKMLGEITIEDFEKIFSTNVFGLTLLTQEVLPYLIGQSSGHIINVASTAAIRGYASGSVYSSSKFALRGLTECWRAELRQHNIRVILVNPSEVPTAFNQPGRIERSDEPSKLTSDEIAHTIKAALEMDNRGFIPEVTVWATNPQ